MTFLTEPQRRTVFDKVLTLVDTKFAGTDIDVTRLREAHEARVVNSHTAEDFEEALNGVLRDLKTSHTGLFHEARPRSGGRIAMAATLTKADTAIDGHRWVFQDVHPGGVAAVAGIESGDVLLAVNDQDLVPPAAIPFRLGESYEIAVRKPDGSSTRATLAIPGSREKKRPIVVPDQVVSARKLDAQVGYIRVSMFPGVLGMDVARDISRAVAELGCDRLVVDLRGNTGGGIGCLRLMSHLCADRRGVGYSVGRKLARRGYDKNRLPQFDRIPSSKVQVLPLIVKFGLAGRSVAVFTEALGAQRHHGQVAMLVNEHSASAAEMVAAFASEYRLATLVGTTTAGRLVATSAFKVGFGYRVVMPVATYFTWHGTNLEGRGLAPTIEEPFSFEASVQGRDNQLERATQVVREIEKRALAGASA
ncbi:MAG TPA: S41 family peptidase [Vicinamibacterales bacterium]|nr:S41 family peptidase [Vicinamibacterales bacterium]